MTELELHKISSPIYWKLRSEGFNNIEAEIQIARYKKWVRLATNKETEVLIG